MRIEIKKGIPLPDDKPYTGFNGRPSKYPFAEMEVGDVVDYPGERNGGKVHSYAMRANQLHDVKFASQDMGTFMRFWRLS